MMSVMHATPAGREPGKAPRRQPAHVALPLLALFALVQPASGQTCNGKPLSDWAAMLEDLSASRKFQAAANLGQCGPGAAPALPALNKVLRDEKVSVDARLAVAKAVFLIDRDSRGEDTVRFLTGVLQNSPQPSFKEGAIDALGAAGPRACGARPLIEAGLNTYPGSTRLKANKALDAIRPC